MLKRTRSEEMISGPGSKLRQLEKFAYIVGLPITCALGGYTIYNRNVRQAEEKAQKLREVEERFLAANKDNMVKLQNFNKRVFAIGTVDDLGVADRESEAHKVAISKNAAVIRNFLKEVAPEQVVLEMCDERYQEELEDIITHPNYDRTMSQVHRLLSQKNPKRLLRFEDQIAIN